MKILKGTQVREHAFLILEENALSPVYCRAQTDTLLLN